MRLWIVALPVAVLSGLFVIGAGKTPRSLAPVQRPQYVLGAKTEILNGIRAYPETVYTYSEAWPGGRTRELWRIRLNDKYAMHWVSESGRVWVLTDGMPGPGGGARLWVRDATANLLAEWQAADLFNKIEPKGKSTWSGIFSDRVDAARSVARSLPGGAEQLSVATKDGGEIRATLVSSEWGRPFALIRGYKPGEPRSDLLSAALSQPSIPPKLMWPLGDDSNFAVWQFQVGQQKPILQVFQHYREGPFQLLTEKSLDSIPTYVTKTPGGRVLWFSFGQPYVQGPATLDVLSLDGTQSESIDLLKLGKFQSADQARRSLRYRDVAVMRGAMPVSLDDVDWYSAGKSEELRMSDRDGREYVVKILPTDDANRFKVEAIASMNLERIEPKEPIYPDSKPVGQDELWSTSRQFQVSAKTYEKGATRQTQLTLTEHLVDPVKGAKAVQLWSMPVAFRPSGLRVSDSGRVYTLTFGQWPEGPMKGKDLALFQCYDPSGRTLGAIDFTNMHWFADAAEAKKNVDLEKLDIEMLGLRGEIEIQGVPVPTWPSEKLTFRLNNGQVKNLYIARVNDMFPSMIYTGPPPSKAGSGG